MTLFQGTVLPLLAFLLAREILRTKRLAGRQRLRGWLRAALWLGGGVLVAFPDLATAWARSFGIGRGADFVFYVAVVLGTLAVLGLYRRQEKLERELVETIRQIALQRVSAPDDRKSSEN